MAGIYIIENNANGMVYIGRSAEPEERFKAHKSHLRFGSHSNRLLQSDYDKYGEDCFTFLVIEECSDEDTKLKELEWIMFFRLQNVAPIYNDLGKQKHTFLLEFGELKKSIERVKERLERRML